MNTASDDELDLFFDSSSSFLKTRIHQNNITNLKNEF